MKGLVLSLVLLVFSFSSELIAQNQEAVLGEELVGASQYDGSTLISTTDGDISTSINIGSEVAFQNQSASGSKFGTFSKPTADDYANADVKKFTPVFLKEPIKVKLNLENSIYELDLE